MEPKSLSAINKELKILRSFYNVTLLAYEQADEFLSAQQDTRAVRQSPPRTESRSSKRRKKGTIQQPSVRNRTESMLRELILVRAISALETFLTDAIRDIFLVTKSPFMDKSVKLEFSQEELIANNSPTKLFNRIISRETRKLTSGGFNDFIKYYKKRFGIDLASISPGYKVMNEYHDRRHILVHRLGYTDDKYRKKYTTDLKKIGVDAGYVKALLKDIEIFSSALGNQLEDFITNSSTDISMSKARYVVDIEFRKQDIPPCLQPSFQFWADDEYVILSDILIRTNPTEDKRVRYYFAGSDRALRRIQKYLRRELQRLTIAYEIIENRVRVEKRPKKISANIIQQVQKEMPPQPWEKGIHKQVANKLGLSNGAVTSAIDALILKGVFKDQVDGKLMG